MPFHLNEDDRSPTERRTLSKIRLTSFCVAFFFLDFRAASSLFSNDLFAVFLGICYYAIKLNGKDLSRTTGRE
jgi:hypothetical protein